MRAASVLQAPLFLLLCRLPSHTLRNGRTGMSARGAGSGAGAGAGARNASTSSVGVVWIKPDHLRLLDNEPLFRAHAECGRVVHLFVFDPYFYGKGRETGLPKTAYFRARFMLEAVADLRKVRDGRMKMRAAPQGGRTGRETVGAAHITPRSALERRARDGGGRAHYAEKRTRASSLT